MLILQRMEENYHFLDNVVFVTKNRSIMYDYFPQTGFNQLNLVSLISKFN